MHTDINKVVDKICREAVKIQKAKENQPVGSFSRLIWIGEYNALRTALCYIHGWDPENDADKDGKADNYINNWWKQHHPEDWE